MFEATVSNGNNDDMSQVASFSVLWSLLWLSMAGYLSCGSVAVQLSAYHCVGEYSDIHTPAPLSTQNIVAASPKAALLLEWSSYIHPPHLSLPRLRSVRMYRWRHGVGLLCTFCLWIVGVHNSSDLIIFLMTNWIMKNISYIHLVSLHSHPNCRRSGQ